MRLSGSTSHSRPSPGSAGPIRRFSEDIDVTVFRDDLGQAFSVEELGAMSKTKRVAALNDIRRACREFIQGQLRDELTAIAAEAAGRTGLPADAFEVRPALTTTRPSCSSTPR